MDEILKSTATQGLGVVVSIYLIYFITNKVYKMLEKQQEQISLVIQLLKKVVEKDEK